MTHLLLLSALVILACVLCNKLSSKLGVPTLLAFILLGMFFGSDGVVKIPFDNYGLAQNICSFALIFIMFYGGFGTNWSQAKPVAGKAAILSSFGTAFTAGLVGLFCWAVLSLPTLESFLLGAVIASTDAASVFSILRSKRLNLRDHTASLLEVESGSNDPFSYMLTLILLTLMTGEISAPAVVYQIFAQLVYGGALGVGVALAARAFLRRFRFASEGFDAIFLVAVALLSYVVPTLLEGNGYLSVYITGILLGNSQLENKKALVNFFDGATGLMQMLLFFLPAARHRPHGPGRGPLPHFCGPAGGGLSADGPLPQQPPSDGPGRLVGDAGGGLHRVLHSGHYQSRRHQSGPLPHCLLHRPLFHPGPGHPYPRGGQKAEHDRPGGQRLENLHRLHR